MDGVAPRGGGGDDVAHHVAAGGQRGEERAVHLGDRRAELSTLDHVELHALPGGEAERAISMRLGERVEGQPLRRGEAPSGRADAHHEGPVLILAGLLAGGRGVAVELLVGAVELEQRVGGLRQAATRLGGVELLGERAAQAAAAALDMLGCG